ncbi:SEC1 family transporter SLY1 [Thraustotheca clavata]|uniref:SEC1 family transporter SLY1 n=1 Tax=Thraustotheca clavata TaxID=74557 RepID=A0A1V9Z8I0_9STRA|nr:SEC1 family transporter SLY1 [Thraustotheca clavata]
MVLLLQEKQKENLLRMLDFNVEAVVDVNNAWGEQWKVLVYDPFCRDIISPILKLHELRKKGVTLHMLLENEREDIPDVPAVYFVLPTEANLERIVADCAKQLYSTIHVNFAAPIPRQRLEYFAKGCVNAGCTSMISKVFDQYANFVCLEPQLFSLNQADSYRAYNDASFADSHIEQTMHDITTGLFSVLATLGVVPVIRAPSTDGPSRMVAEELNQVIRDHLSSRSGVFQDANTNYQRPVLIIVDRNEDLASALHHPSTYQALVDDMLKIKLNRVNVRVANDKGQTTEKSYDLDVKSDKFFEQHAGAIFPDAIAANEEELKVVTKKEKEISAKASGQAPLSGGTKDLVAAVDTLPVLLEKKKSLEVHTNIFHATFESVSSRHVHEFSMLEQKLMDGSHVPKQDVLELISSPNKGNVTDKLRLMMVYYLANGSDIAEIESAFGNIAGSEAYERAWCHIKMHTSFQKQSASVNAANATGEAAAGSSKLKGYLAANWAGSFAGHAQGFLSQAAESFKNFLPENKKLQLARITDAICELKPNTEDESYLYLDPKIKATANIPRQRTPFREVLVFVIGGGNYNEFQNIQTYAKVPLSEVFYEANCHF